MKSQNAEYDFARLSVQSLQINIRKAIEAAIATGPNPALRFVDLDQVVF